jgi:CHASE2 domain-containing sensor protein
MRNFGGYQTVDAGGHQIFLNYRHLKSPDLIADQVTLGDVLANRVAPDAIRDRIVLIGTTDRSFGDYWETPYRDSSTSDQEIAGVFIQAQMTSQILGAVLDNRPLIQAWPNSLEIIWILVWSGLGAVIVCWVNPLFSTKTTPLRVLLTVLLAESCLFGISWWLLVQFGYWVPTIPPALSLAAIVGATITLHTFNFHHSS